MNKQRKVDYKKTIVRNTEKPILKTKVVVEDEKKSLTNLSSETGAIKRKPHKPLEERCEVSKTSLDLPELYSTLKISKKIDDIVKPRKTKSSDVDKKLAVDEKVSRKVNFPYDQPIYKDLIPLACRKIQSQPMPSREPLPHKDKEPNLSDFLTPAHTPQFFYAPNIKIEIKPVIITCDNSRLYRTLQKYNDDFITDNML